METSLSPSLLQSFHVATSDAFLSSPSPLATVIRESSRVTIQCEACKRQAPVHVTALSAPPSLALAINWPSDHVDKLKELDPLLRLIRADFSIDGMYRNVAAGGRYWLGAIVCFWGNHYFGTSLDMGCIVGECMG